MTWWLGDLAQGNQFFLTCGKNIAFYMLDAVNPEPTCYAIRPKVVLGAKPTQVARDSGVMHEPGLEGPTTSCTLPPRAQSNHTENPINEII
jgi:hypothetical protein